MEAFVRENLATKRHEYATIAGGPTSYSIAPKEVNWTDNSMAPIEMNQVSWNDATSTDAVLPVPVVQEIRWYNDMPQSQQQQQHHQRQALNDNFIASNEVKWGSDSRTNREDYSTHQIDSNSSSYGLPVMEVKSWTNDYEHAYENEIQTDMQRFLWDGSSTSVGKMPHMLNLTNGIEQSPDFVHPHASRSTLEMQAIQVAGGDQLGFNGVMKSRFEDDTMRAMIGCKLHNERMQEQQQRSQTTLSKVCDMSQEMATTREELYQERIMRDRLSHIMVTDNGSIINHLNHSDNSFANHGMALVNYNPATIDVTKMRPSLISQESVTILTMIEPVGLTVDPKCVTFETMPGMIQSFWVGVVAAEIADSRVKAGDMVVYVGPHLSMVDKTCIRNAKEFSSSLEDMIKVVPAPHIMQLVRCKSINVAEDPATQYTLGPMEGKEIASMIFNQGDSGMLLLNRNKLLIEKVDMDESMNPDNRTKRLQYQARMDRQFEAELQGQKWRPDLPSDGNNINNNQSGYMHMSHQSYGNTLSPSMNYNMAPFSSIADSTLMMTNDLYGGSLDGVSSGGRVNLMLTQEPWMMSNTGMESSSQGALTEINSILLADQIAVSWQQGQQQQLLQQPMYPQQHYIEYAQEDMIGSQLTWQQHQQEHFELPQQHQHQLSDHRKYYNVRTADV